MFAQLSNVKGLKIEESKANDSCCDGEKSIFLFADIHDELEEKTKRVQITIPRGTLNAKIIKENVKDGNASCTKCKLRLDFDLNRSSSADDKFYKINEISKSDQG